MINLAWASKANGYKIMPTGFKQRFCNKVCGLWAEIPILFGVKIARTQLRATLNSRYIPVIA